MGSKALQKFLDENKTAFIRIERCSTYPREGFIRLHAVAEDYEYNGVVTKYSLSCMGEHIRCLEKNDGHVFYQADSDMDLYINPEDIMQF